jgi:hypothetical protein
MPLHNDDLPTVIRERIAEGLVIPAHPLALGANRQLDPHRLRALTRYYLDAGAGGLAVGVHTTQFAIRQAGLYEPVLALARSTVSAWTDQPVAMIAGIAGPTEQARSEADTAVGLGYHAGLLSLAHLKGASEDDLIAHCRAVAERIPLFGFYLQTAVGGIRLRESFWRRFAEIENVIGIKIAPFNRYATLDVVRGVVAAAAEDRITLYTGNDDHIIGDLLARFDLRRGDHAVSMRIKGGLLGHWSVWTRSAVEIFHRCRAATASNSVDADLLALDAAVTDCNAALFDVANDFRGVIAGCHEILRRQGLLEGIWCLDPDEDLGPGQAAELDRVTSAYPELTDDRFVRENRDRWLE